MKNIFIAVFILLSFASGAQMEVRGTAVFFKNLNDASTHFLVDEGSPGFTLGSDATGDIFYRKANGLLGRIAIGTGAQTLHVVGGIPAWLDTAAAGGGSPTPDNINGTASADVTADMGTHALNITTSDGSNIDLLDGAAQIAVNGVGTFSMDGGDGILLYDGEATPVGIKYFANYYSGQKSTGCARCLIDRGSAQGMIDSLAGTLGGGGMTIAAPISGATGGRMLYTGTGGILQHDANLVYDSTKKILAANSLDIGSHFYDVNVTMSVYDGRTYLFTLGTAGGSNNRMVLKSAGYLGLGDFLPGTANHFEQRILASNVVGYVLRGASGQIADMINWTTSTPATLGGIAANGGIFIGSSTLGTSRIFDLTTTTLFSKPFPPMTTAQRNAISSPAAGDGVYCSDCTASDASTGVITIYNGATWKNAW